MGKNKFWAYALGKIRINIWKKTDLVQEEDAKYVKILN